MSKTLANLRDTLSEGIEDYLHSTVTTALAASTSIVDTALANVTGGTTTDYFLKWWALITSENNAGQNRIVSAYNTTSKTLTVQGNNFTSDGADLATYELHRFNPAEKTRVINQAAKELYSTLFRHLRDRTLVGGNPLPGSHFDWWTSASALKFYSTSNATLAQTSTAGLTWGGIYSAKVTVSAANGYMYISSNSYPRLLDLMGKTISFHCYAYPEVADDAFIEIYTIQADGTTQTLTSTTACPAGKWTLLTLEDQTLNDDLSEVQFRFKVATNSKYAYFDAAWVSGSDTYELMLPELFQDGILSQVRYQVTGHSDEIADDIGWETPYELIWGWKVRDDNTYKYLVLPSLYSERRLELIGYCPLENTLSSDTDTMTIDDPYTQLLIACATMLLYEHKRSLPSLDSTELYNSEFNRWFGRTEELKRRLRMAKPAFQIGVSL